MVRIFQSKFSISGEVTQAGQVSQCLFSVRADLRARREAAESTYASVSNDLLAIVLVHGQAALSNIADFTKSLEISENSFAAFALWNDVIEVEHNSRIGSR